jgi:hypothetical protein
MGLLMAMPGNELAVVQAGHFQESPAVRKVTEGRSHLILPDLQEGRAALMVLVAALRGEALEAHHLVPEE